MSEEFRIANATRAWAYDYPDLNGRSSLYETLHSALRRRNPAAMLHVQVDLIRQLAGLVDETDSGRLTFRNGRPRVGEILIVDGTQQQSNVRQVKGINDEHDLHINGRHSTARFVSYHHDGREVKRNRGHNIVVIADGATNLPIISLPFAANVSERDAVSDLLGILFNLWPDCPARFIVGDSHYDHSKSFARELELKWKLHPIFPLHGGRGDPKWPMEQEQGVPRCLHGFMTYEPEGFFDGGSSVTKDWQRGEEHPLDYRPRIVCKCPAKICKTVYLNLRDDPWWIRYVPMAGESRLRMFGAAALARRNGIESIYALLQMSGFWGAGPLRPKWASQPEEVVWAYVLPMLMVVAKRLAYESGLYDEVLEEAERFGLLTAPTPGNPNPGPDSLVLAAAREHLPIEPAPPETWSHAL